jgi:hypothetical protein
MRKMPLAFSESKKSLNVRDNRFWMTGMRKRL